MGRPQTASAGRPVEPVVRSWASERYGITVTHVGSPVDLTLHELVRIGLRRNPKRAQLLVSTVLGKHVPADPRVVAGTGRLLGALAARALAGDDAPVPEDWARAAAQTLSAVGPGALLELLDGVRPGVPDGVLTLGFAETATALGHLVADQLHSDYLHSTRRQDGSVPVRLEFAEPHSHATGHLLRPGPPDLLGRDGPVVLVDDELSTGTTALNVIEALHRIHPRGRYVLAGLVDVRSPQDDRRRGEVAARLRCRIDVVALARGGITVPDDAVVRVADDLAFEATHESNGESTGESVGDGGRPPGVERGTRAPSGLLRIEIPWPAGVPAGGRHGFRPRDRSGFDAAVVVVADRLAAACGDARRVLVLGTEELMYLPLRIALALQRKADRQVAFQSTTRSPVHAVDRIGYPIRRRIDFTVRAPDEAAFDGVLAGGLRHVYNVGWPSCSGEKSFVEPDLVIVVDDGRTIDGPDGLAARIAATTGARVILCAVRESRS